MDSYVLVLEIEFSAPNPQAAKKTADRIAEFVFVDDEVNAVLSDGVYPGTVENLA